MAWNTPYENDSNKSRTKSLSNMTGMSATMHLIVVIADPDTETGQPSITTAG
jgi:hypothetical protein